MFKWLKDKLRQRQLVEAMKIPLRPMLFQSAQVGQLTGVTNSTITNEPEDTREEVRPIDIIHLIETEVSIDLKDLDKKLKKLEEEAIFHAKVLKRGVPENLFHAIEVLKARKQYPEAEQYIPWHTTTQDKIDDLCKKYQLRHASIDLFVPDFPREVLEEVRQFNKVHKIAVRGKEDTLTHVELSVIAPPELFRTVPRGDPILLAASPFGEFFYILCAWDKEVDYLGDLL